MKSGHYEVRYKASHDPYRVCDGAAFDERHDCAIGELTMRRGGSDPVAIARGGAGALVRRLGAEETAAAAAEAAMKSARPMSQNAYKVDVAKTAVKRAILRAAGIQTA